jgi:hypothetical protein
MAPSESADSCLTEEEEDDEDLPRTTSALKTGRRADAMKPNRIDQRRLRMDNKRENENGKLANHLNWKKQRRQLLQLWPSDH